MIETVDELWGLAVADFFAHDAQLYAAAWWLGSERRPFERCGLMRVLADGCRRQAGLRDAAFGGGDSATADELADGARLTAILAEAEHCRRIPAATQSTWYASWHDSRTIELQHAVDHHLDAWVSDGPSKRLHTAICQTWADMVGGQAVECAWQLGLPPRRWRWRWNRP